jgi:predicted transcriptional regulator of viral defense system
MIIFFFIVMITNPLLLLLLLALYFLFLFLLLGGDIHPLSFASSVYHPCVWGYGDKYSYVSPKPHIREVEVGKKTSTEQLVRFVREHGLVRQHEIEDAGFHTFLLYRLRDRGELIQLASGLFTHPDYPVSEKQGFAEASKLVPNGVVCLTSALAFHEIGVQLPRETWLALNREETRKRPRVEDLAIEFVWFSGRAYREGQQTHTIAGVEVRVYSPAKTIADLFKYRHKLGIDVALEALREGWRDRLVTTDQLEHFAKICGVSRVMRPYLQALVTI